MRRAAGVVSGLTGLGFGVPGIIGLAHFVRTGGTWTFLGFPTYGGGPFERIGLETSVPLLAGFVAVCGAEIAVGVLAVRNAPSARAASYLILPFELAYWIGFALPAGPLLGLARVVLLRRRP